MLHIAVPLFGAGGIFGVYLGASVVGQAFPLGSNWQLMILLGDVSFSFCLGSFGSPNLRT